MNNPIPFHEIAEVFPMMEAASFDALKADIAANGQREPIYTYEGKVLDGRNRYVACLQIERDPVILEYVGLDPVGFVVSLNINRRHLTDSQRAMAATKLAELQRGQKKSDAHVCAPVSQHDAATLMDVSRRSVQSARKVRDSGVPGLTEAVESGKVSVSAAAKVAALPKKEQAAIVARGPDAVTEKAAEIRHKSKVNGVLAHDPPDIAAARASGKIGADVVVEVTEPEGSPAALEPEPDGGVDLSDEEWLATLPARATLTGSCRKAFDAESLVYRRLEPHRKTFAYHAARLVKSGSRRPGEYSYRLKRFLGTDHPKLWLVCPPTDHDGCGGSGQLIIGECPKCRGKGFWIK